MKNMAKNKKIAKKPNGRPTKFKPKYIEIAEGLCLRKGYTDKDLAKHFKISERTLYVWKNRHLEFSEAIKKGKDEFDSRVVEQSLLKRAVGYTYDEITQEPDKETGKLVTVKVVSKQVAGDVLAMIFWLKNRNPQRWSDKKEIDHRIEGITEPLTEEELLSRVKKAKAAGTGVDMKSIEGNDNGHSDQKKE